MSENRHEAAQQRIDELSTDSKKQKTVTRIVVVLLVVLFLGGMVWGVFRILDTEEVQEPTAAITDKTYIDAKDMQAVIGYFAGCTINITDSKTEKVDVKSNIWIDDDTISFENETPKLSAALMYMKNQWLEKVAERRLNTSTDFGESFNKLMLPVNFNPAHLKSIDVDIGRMNDEGVLEDENCRFITFTFPAYGEYEKVPIEIITSTGIDGINSVMLNAEELLSDLFSLSEIKLDVAEIRIEAKINRETDKLDYIKYTRVYDVAATIQPVNELKSIEAQDIKFVLNSETEYTFTHAGVKLNNHELWLKKGNSESLQAERIAGGDVKVKWESSAPDIVSVDDEGYVKSHAVSDKPVTITASFEYLGNTFSDSCEVWSVKPVNKVKLEEETAELKAGETVQLHASVVPAEATVKQVVWGSSDESIAAVDKNGLVTAVKPGTVTIYVLARDGWFKQTCTITVK